MQPFTLFEQTTQQRVSDRASVTLFSDLGTTEQILVMVWPHFGDFDTLEYAWWLKRSLADLNDRKIAIRAIAIGDCDGGQRFCDYTGFPAECLFVDPEAKLHQKLDLYPGLSLKLPGLGATPSAWFNLLLMCAGIGSPGTLREVLRGYTGDRQAPQLIADEEVVQAPPLPPIKGKFFRRAGGSDFQRPFELATLRLRNMAESLSHWRTYVPDARFLTQRGGTWLFNRAGELLYEHRDRGILGFADNMGAPLAFIPEQSTLQAH
ncbi:MAG: peroxiredoxin-like family protein [Cyanobacteria bacterium P01_H01_bin.121]